MSEFNYPWSFTSTGDGNRVDGRTVFEWTFYIETAAGTTATVEILSARDTTSTTVGVVLGSSQTLDSGSLTRILQFTGPFCAIWPRVASMTSTGTVIVRGLGVS